MSGTRDSWPICTRCGVEYAGGRCPDCEREDTEIEGVPFLEVFDEVAFTEPAAQERWDGLRRLCEAGYEATWIADQVTSETQPTPLTMRLVSMGKVVHTLSVRYPDGSALADGRGDQFADALIAAFPDGVPEPERWVHLIDEELGLNEWRRVRSP